MEIYSSCTKFEVKSDSSKQLNKFRIISDQNGSEISIEVKRSRPGEKITRKSILMQKKIKELDKTEVRLK